MDKEMAHKISRDLDIIRREKEKLLSEQGRLEKERMRLEEQERALAVAVRFYEGEASSVTPSVQPDAAEDGDEFTMLTIAKAAERILRSLDNQWTTIRQLEDAFAQRGKKTTYNAIDGTLRDSAGFERRKLGRLNQFRLRSDSEW